MRPSTEPGDGRAPAAPAPTPPPARLAPPPRRVPPSLATRALLGPGLLAWLWFSCGTPSAALLLRVSDLTSWATFRGTLPTAGGTALACERTGYSEGARGERHTGVYATRYRFEEDGVAREGVSYALGRCPEPGSEVVVEHLPGRPDVSRIAGMRRAPYGPDSALILVFPLAGIVMIAVTLRTGRRELALLRDGRLEGGMLRVPGPPELALAWEKLRCTPRVDGAGALAPVRAWVVLLVSVPPVLGLIGLAVAVSAWLP